MQKTDGILLSEINGQTDILDSEWNFTVADNDYRDIDPIKIQANGVYVRPNTCYNRSYYKDDYRFGLIFRCSKKGGKLKLTRIIVSGEINSKTRLKIRDELTAKFSYLKKSKMRLL